MKNVPWAKWLAHDRFGHLYAFEHEPIVNDKKWETTGRFEKIKDSEYGSGYANWQASLTKITLPENTAHDFLERAGKHMADRAATYDKPEGERSMGKTVAAFNAITGRDLSESEGWLLMSVLKMVRDRQRANPHIDSIEDNIAYAALYGEARLKEIEQ